MTTRELTTDVRPVATAPVTVTPGAITIVIRLPRSWGDAAVATARLLTGPGARRVAVIALGAATGLGPLGGAALEAAVEVAAGAVTTARERTVRSGGTDNVVADPGEGDRRGLLRVTRAGGPAARRGARPRPRPGRPARRSVTLRSSPGIAAPAGEFSAPLDGRLTALVAAHDPARVDAVLAFLGTLDDDLADLLGTGERRSAPYGGPGAPR